MTLIRRNIVVVISSICVFFSQNITGMYLYGEEINKNFFGYTENKIKEKINSDALAHYMMGAIYDNLGETQNAVREYRKALAKEENVSKIRIKLATDLLLQGKPDKAIENLNIILQKEPDNIKSYLLLATIYIGRGEIRKAQEQYRKALEYDPENLSVLAFLSDFFVAQQKLDKAAEVYEKILKLKSDDAFIYFNLGVIYSKLNLLDKAEERVGKAIEVDKNYLEAQMFLGFIYEVDSKFAEAIKQYKKVTRIDPDNRGAHVRLGQLYHRLGETEKAIQQNRTFMELDRHSSEPYLMNFSIYISEKRYEEAAKVLQEALQNEINDPSIYASLGYLEGLKKDYGRAIKYYSTAIAKEPDNAMYKFYFAAAMERSGRRQEAIDVLEEIVSKKNNIPEAYNYLGYLYAEEGKNLDKAITLIKKALELDPENGAYIDSLGWAYYKKGMLDEALEQLKKAIEYLSGDAVVRDHLGDVYAARGELGKAVKEWKKSVKLDPKNKVVEKKLEKMRKKVR